MRVLAVKPALDLERMNVRTRTLCRWHYLPGPCHESLRMIGSRERRCDDRLRNLEHARDVIGAFIETYYREWLLERHGHRTASRHRRDARRHRSFPFGNDPGVRRTVGNYWPWATKLFDTSAAQGRSRCPARSGTTKSMPPVHGSSPPTASSRWIPSWTQHAARRHRACQRPVRPRRTRGRTHRPLTPLECAWPASQNRVSSNGRRPADRPLPHRVVTTIAPAEWLIPYSNVASRAPR
jgi:hypothetical protein